MSSNHRNQGRNNASSQGPPMPAMGRIVVGVAITVALLVLIWGNLVTRIFVVFVLLGTLSGYRLGAAKVAAAFSGLVFAALLAVPLGKALEGSLGGAFGLNGLTKRMVSIAIVAVINLVIVTAVARSILTRVVKIRPDWTRYDKLCGSGLGLIQGGLIGCLLIWSVLFLEPFAVGGLTTSEGPEGNGASNPPAEYVASLAKAARESAFGRAAEAVNPLDDIRLISLFQKGVLVLNDPVTRDAFVRHRAIEGIRDYPSVKTAMGMFSADPQIQQFVNAEHDIRIEDIRALLDSPTLLAILDETSIVADLSPIAADIEQAIEHTLANVANQSGVSASAGSSP